MMTETVIKNSGEVCIFMFDDIHKHVVDSYTWQITNHGYVRAMKNAPHKRGSIVYLHRLLMDAEGLTVDHINHNKLDNRLCNLRVCTKKQNAQNKSPMGSSKYLGVWFDKSKNKWCAEIRPDNKKMFLGRFDNEEDAGRSYDKKAKELYGEFANLNFK